MTQGLKGNRLAPGNAWPHPDCAAHYVRMFQAFPLGYSICVKVHLTESRTTDTDKGVRGAEDYIPLLPEG